MGGAAPWQARPVTDPVAPEPMTEDYRAGDAGDVDGLDIRSRSLLQLTAGLIQAIRADDREEFCVQTQMGVAFFTQREVVELLGTHLKTLLNEEEATRLYAWMLGFSW